MDFVQIVDFDWLPWQPKCLIFEKKKFKNFFLKSHKGGDGVKLKLCINICVIILYIDYIFIAVALVVSLLWQL